MSKIAVLGTGSWGTALASVLADNQVDVTMWSHREAAAVEINDQHRNQKYLPDVELPTNLKATASMATVLRDIDILVLAVPTKAIREVIASINTQLDHPVVVVHVSKGIEPETNLRISEIITDAMTPSLVAAVVALSGPSHAEEVCRRMPTTLTAASTDESAAKLVQNAFSNLNLRVYTHHDIIGTEIGGALKNIIALGAGISDGVGNGDNAKAALITRGMREIIRLGEAVGAEEETFSGLTGIGDLIVTCTSQHSRNWQTGYRLGKGETLTEVLASVGMIVEGVRTTEAVYLWAKKLQISMPITEAIYGILYDEKSPTVAVDELMGRQKKKRILS
ncbi:NAD(P)H-dependent glycerol-3-phosphate dehydrogenase [Brochothrix campestris FSL F6-1037]|uniref:Glycerol-3-phosphate dehydrogenase [NAD(P)+] n=2 Tax=Brochothrix campestris TaxID=2757 RepID=W7CXX0_9LIST|nr:NAD(P)H-dependent glycerol-3-phosphate dehydrogenase [Brochothrix campestris FSL F6-1037]